MHSFDWVMRVKADFVMDYCKIPKISPGAYIFQRAFWGLYSEGLIYGGKFPFQNRDWASLIVGSKFNVFALFYFAFESNFPSTSTWRAYIWRGDLTEGFLPYRLVGLFMTQFGRLPIVGFSFFALLRKWTFGAGYNHQAVVLQPFFLNLDHFTLLVLFSVSWVGTHNKGQLKAVVRSQKH